MNSVSSSAVALFANPLIKFEPTAIKARIKVGNAAGNWTDGAYMLKLNDNCAIVVFNGVRGSAPTASVMNATFELTGATQMWALCHDWIQEGNIYTQQMYKDQHGCWLSGLNTTADIVAYIAVLVRLT